MDASTWPNTMEELKAMGVNYIAPPTWMLVTLENGEIVPSELAIQAKAADLKIITWTIERSGSLVNGGGWYYQSIADAVNSDVACHLHITGIEYWSNQPLICANGSFQFWMFRPV